MKKPKYRIINRLLCQRYLSIGFTLVQKRLCIMSFAWFLFLGNDSGSSLFQKDICILGLLGVKQVHTMDLICFLNGAFFWLQHRLQE